LSTPRAAFWRRECTPRTTRSSRNRSARALHPSAALVAARVARSVAERAAAAGALRRVVGVAAAPCLGAAATTGHFGYTWSAC